MEEQRFVYFDLESTGPNPSEDRIVEMAFCDGVGEILLATRVHPRRPIPAEASEIHGIYDRDVEELPPFIHFSKQVQELIQGAVLIGYNIRRFDSILLHRELQMAGERGLETDTHGRIIQPEIDLFGMWQRLEPRKLANAAKRFAGMDLENAHAALEDTTALPWILVGMAQTFGLSDDGPPPVEQLIELSAPEGAVDRDGKFRKRDDGVVVFTIGQTTRDQPVLENPGMLRWILERDFSADTQYYARLFLKEASLTPAGSGF